MRGAVQNFGFRVEGLGFRVPGPADCAKRFEYIYIYICIYRFTHAYVYIYMSVCIHLHIFITQNECTCISTSTHTYNFITNDEIINPNFRFWDQLSAPDPPNRSPRAPRALQRGSMHFRKIHENK